MKIAIANDHTAINLKNEILAHLLSGEGVQGISEASVRDFGIAEGDEAEYPMVGARVAKAVAAGEYDFGILLCGTGAGIGMAAGKVRGIRAVMCSEPYTARLSREHNDANILCIGARVVGVELAKMIVDTWLGAGFEGGRHQARVDMIMGLED